jgi:ribosomal-protein-alanine N-acetyltransferase
MPDNAVETARLLLRPFAPGDIAAYAAIRAKPAVMRFMPGGEARAATARQDAERLVPLFAEQWRSVGYGPWAAIETARGALIGHIGLRLLPEVDGETEILYMLDDTAWGRGLASEGAAAARDFAFDRLGLARVIALARPENRTSIRVMEKTGLAFEREIDFAGMRVAYHALDRARRPA